MHNSLEHSNSRIFSWFTPFCIKPRKQITRVQYQELWKERLWLKKTEFLSTFETQSQAHSGHAHITVNITAGYKKSRQHFLLKLVIREELETESHSQIFIFPLPSSDTDWPLWANYGRRLTGDTIPRVSLKHKSSPWKLSIRSQSSPLSTPFVLDPGRSRSVIYLPPCPNIVRFETHFVTNKNTVINHLPSMWDVFSLHLLPLCVTLFSTFLFPLCVTLFSLFLFPLCVTIFSLCLFPLCEWLFSLHLFWKLQASRDQGVSLSRHYILRSLRLGWAWSSVQLAPHTQSHAFNLQDSRKENKKTLQLLTLWQRLDSGEKITTYTITRSSCAITGQHT